MKRQICVTVGRYRVPSRVISLQEMLGRTNGHSRSVACRQSSQAGMYLLQFSGVQISI
jgi:hypothetical protein